MICLRSPRHGLLKTALDAYAATGDVEPWERACREAAVPGADGLLAFLDHPISQTFFGSRAGPLFRSEGGAASFKDWVFGMSKLQGELLDRARTAPDQFLLFLVWTELRASVARNLRAARLSGALPPSGGLLCYVAGLEVCAVLSYEFWGEKPRLDVIAVITDPRSVFDFFAAIEQADPRSRNQLKWMLTSGHKIVWQRGTLVHVDRRLDAGVFGPTIDTLVLNEILHQQVFEAGGPRPARVLEVGCGNGLLSAALAVHGGCRELYAVDTSASAVSCTVRNVRAACAAAERAGPEATFVVGRFRPDLFARRFDLVVCNPPYIPLPPRADRCRSDRFYEAVGGVDLLCEIVRRAPRFLAPGGRLLVMVSHLAVDDVLASAPAGVELGEPLGRGGLSVPFDVEAVLNDETWLRYLVAERGLRQSAGVYHHDLRPLWIRRSA